jgi:hypothetical protein
MLPRVLLLGAQGSSASNLACCPKSGKAVEFRDCPKVDGHKPADNKAQWQEWLLAAQDGRFEDISGTMFVRFQITWHSANRHELVVSNIDGRCSLSLSMYILCQMGISIKDSRDPRALSAH